VVIRLLAGDCRTVLATLPADSVHTVVTSPPYYGLRDYGTAQWDGGDAGCSHVAVGTDRGSREELPKPPAGWAERAQGYANGRHCTRCGATRVDRQIGLEATPDEYLATMVAVFREVRRVLRPDGTCWVNMGDSYSSGTGGDKNVGTVLQGGGYIQKPALRVATKGLPSKQLLMMPARLALALQADGWWLRSDIIWHKPNPMPESCRDRPTSAHEHVFLLTKSARYFYDADAVREGREGNSHSHGVKRSPPIDSAGIGHKDWTSYMTRDEEIVSRNLRNVWTLPTHPYIHAHFATYPPALAERCIKAGTSERGCCSQCGKPWVRVTERNLDNVPTRMATKRAPVDCEAMAAYLRERREALGLSRVAVDTALGTRTLYSWFEGRPAGIEPPTPEQWTKLKDVLQLDSRFDEQIYGTIEVVITDHSPSKAAGVRTYAKAWNSETATTGWRAGCDHEAPVAPCTVLDPFAGAGTTLLVADRLQRDAIGIELNTAYTEMAMERCRDDAPLFVDVPVADPEDERMADLFAEAAE
jgi:DNA modification methylase